MIGTRKYVWNQTTQFISSPLRPRARSPRQLHPRVVTPDAHSALPFADPPWTTPGPRSPRSSRRPSKQGRALQQINAHTSPGPRSYYAVRSGQAAANRMILWPAPSTRAHPARAEPLAVQSIKQPQLDLHSRLHKPSTFRVKAPGRSPLTRPGRKDHQMTPTTAGHPASTVLSLLVGPVSLNSAHLQLAADT